MSVKPDYKTESYVRKITVINSQSVVECRFSFGDDVSEILAVCPQVSAAGCDVSSGRVNYAGRLVCTAVYSDGHGKLNRAQKGAEFTHYADDDILAPAQTAECRLTCERATVKRDGSSFLVTAVIGARITVYGAAERSLLSAAEGAVCRSERLSFLSAVTFSGESEVEDRFEAAGVEDILMHDAKVLVTDCRCGGGEVQISGEVFLSFLAVRGEEAVAMERIIPFSAEILCDDAILPRRAVCSAQIKEASVTAQVNEERGRCDIAFTSRLSFAGVFFDEREEEAVTDAFRTDGEVCLAYSEESAEVCDDIKLYSERVSGACAVKAKIDYTCSFKVAVNPRAECTYSADTCVLEGAVSSVLVYLRDGELHSTDIALPFSVKLNGIEAGSPAEIDVAVSGISVRQRSEGECEAEAVLRIAAAVCSARECRYVSELTEGEQSECSDAFTVLMAGAGDTLWDTAKRLKKPPEELAAVCRGVEFPLRGDERIVIYRPKNI